MRDVVRRTAWAKLVDGDYDLDPPCDICRFLARKFDDPDWECSFCLERRFWRQEAEWQARERIHMKRELRDALIIFGVLGLMIAFAMIRGHAR